MVEIADKRHCEYASSTSTTDTTPCGSYSSKKSIIAAWIRSVLSCSSPPWRSRRRRAPQEQSSQQPRHSRLHQPEITGLLSLSYRWNSSQVSIATSSIKYSFKVATVETTGYGETGLASLQQHTVPPLYGHLPCGNSIRLLRVHKGNFSDLIEITLEVVKLGDTTPDYEALSYVWGPCIAVSQIINNTTKIPISVTKSLYDALKGLRHIGHDRVIWADALCINQTDDKEMSAQVRKINSIYASAMRVIVSFGADDAGDADGAFVALCTLASTKGVSAHYSTKSSQHVQPLQGSSIPLDEDYDLCCKAKMFFCQTWYTRLWVLQEIVLARDAVFIWGGCSISWTYMELAIEAIREDQLLYNLLETRNLNNAFLM